jgi:hypothetical protein
VSSSPGQLPFLSLHDDDDEDRLDDDDEDRLDDDDEDRLDDDDDEDRFVELWSVVPDVDESD